jgi:hypothetical protein
VCAALTLICHLPASLILAPAFVAEVVAVSGVSPHHRYRVGALLGASCLAVGMAAFYLVPAIVELPLVQIEGLTAEGTDFHRHFVPAWLWTHFLWTYDWNYFGTSVSDPRTLMPVHISLVQWGSFLASIAVIGGGLLMRRARADLVHLGVWTCVMAYAMFMMNDASVWIWERVPPLRFVQFPWRFFLLISIAGAALAAALISRIPNRTLAAGLAIAVLLFHIHFYDRRLRPERYIPYAEMNIDSAAWTRDLRRGARDFEEPSYDPIGASRTAAPAAAVTVTGGRAVTSVIVRTDTDLQVRVASFGESRLQVNIPWFPGWSIAVDGTPRAAARTGDGYQAIDLGNGPHVVRAHRSQIPLEVVSNGVTIGSTTILMLLWAAAAWRTKNRDR